MGLGNFLNAVKVGTDILVDVNLLDSINKKDGGGKETDQRDTHGNNDKMLEPYFGYIIHGSYVSATRIASAIRPERLDLSSPTGLKPKGLSIRLAAGYASIAG